MQAKIGKIKVPNIYYENVDVQTRIFHVQFLTFLCLQGPIALTFWKTALIPASIYMFKVNNSNNRTKCKTCSELTIKTPEQPHCHYSGVFIILGSLLSILF